MNNKGFDDIIKQKLNQIAPPKADNAWSIFEQKLDSELPTETSKKNDQDFDKKIFDAISELKPAYKENHWEILRRQLYTIQDRKNTIYISKVLEIAAVFLIGFTFMHITGYFQVPLDHSLKHEIDIYAALNDLDKNVDIIDNQLVVGTPENVIALVEYIDNNTTNLRERLVSPAYLHHKIDNNLKPNHTKSIHDISLSTHSYIKSNVVDDTRIDYFGPLQVDGLRTLNDIKILSTQEGNGTNSATNQKEFNTDLLDLRQSEIHSEYPNSFNMKMVELKKTAKVKKELTVFASADVNLINTPFDKLYSLASYDKEALNNTYGLKYSIRKNNVEWVAGVSYSKRTYQPEIVTEAYGQFGDNYFEKSLDKISFDMLSIPLNIKYHFVSNPTWSTYLLGGVCVNLIADAKYDITEKLREGRPSSRYVPDVARLDEKAFNRGLLNGDQLQSNYFVSLGFGFGIEKKVNNNISLYLEPSYHRHVLSNGIGIGPNNDKIHTTSLEFGIKTTLN